MVEDPNKKPEFGGENGEHEPDIEAYGGAAEYNRVIDALAERKDLILNYPVANSRPDDVKIKINALQGEVAFGELIATLRVSEGPELVEAVLARMTPENRKVAEDTLSELLKNGALDVEPSLSRADVEARIAAGLTGRNLDQSEGNVGNVSFWEEKVQLLAEELARLAGRTEPLNFRKLFIDKLEKKEEQTTADTDAEKTAVSEAVRRDAEAIFEKYATGQMPFSEVDRLLSERGIEPWTLEAEKFMRDYALDEARKKHAEPGPAAAPSLPERRHAEPVRTGASIVEKTAPLIAVLPALPEQSTMTVEAEDAPESDESKLLGRLESQRELYVKQYHEYLLESKARGNKRGFKNVEEFLENRPIIANAIRKALVRPGDAELVKSGDENRPEVQAALERRRDFIAEIQIHAPKISSKAARSIYELELRKADYEAAKVGYARELVTQKRRDLETKLDDPKQLESELRRFKAEKIFSKMVLGEHEELQKAKAEMWPPKEKSIWRKAWEGYARIPRQVRWLVSAGLAGGVALAGGAAVGAALIAGGLGLSRAVASALAGMGADKAAALGIKGWEATIGKTKTKEYQAGELREAFGREDDMETFLEQASDRYGRISTDAARRQRHQNIGRLLIAAGAGMGTAFTLTNIARAEGLVGPPVARGGAPGGSAESPYGQGGDGYAPHEYQPAGGAPPLLEHVDDIPGGEPVPLDYIETASRGDSVWRLIERQLEEHGLMKSLHERVENGEISYDDFVARKTYITDAIKDRIAANPGEFGLHDADHVGVGQEIDLSRAFAGDTGSIIRKAELLTPKEINGILANNAKISEWLEGNPGRRLTSAEVMRILSGEHPAVYPVPAEGVPVVEPEITSVAAAENGVPEGGVNPGLPPRVEEPTVGSRLLAQKAEQALGPSHSVPTAEISEIAVPVEQLPTVEAGAPSPPLFETLGPDGRPHLAGANDVPHQPPAFGKPLQEAANGVLERGSVPIESGWVYFKESAGRDFIEVRSLVAPLDAEAIVREYAGRNWGRDVIRFLEEQSPGQGISRFEGNRYDIDRVVGDMVTAKEALEKASEVQKPLLERFLESQEKMLVNRYGKTFEGISQKV